MSHGTYLNQLIINEKNNLSLILSQDIINYEEAFNSVNCIIDLKFLSNYTDVDSIYIDIKKFIKYYILAVDSRDNGYDKINVEQIYRKLSRLDNTQKLQLLEFFKRELKKSEYIDEISDCEKWINKTKEALCWDNFSLKNLILYLGLVSSRNLGTLTITFVIIIAFTFLITLPAPHPQMETIQAEFINISDSDFRNRVLNIIILFLDFENKLDIKPLNTFGVILLGAIKVIYITVFINYFWKKIVEQIKIVD